MFLSLQWLLRRVVVNKLFYQWIQKQCFVCTSLFLMARLPRGSDWNLRHSATLIDYLEQWCYTCLWFHSSTNICWEPWSYNNIGPLWFGTCVNIFPTIKHSNTTTTSATSTLKRIILCIKKSIGIEVRFSKVEMDNEWNINFLQNNAFDIQHTYSRKFYNMKFYCCISFNVLKSSPWDKFSV